MRLTGQTTIWQSGTELQVLRKTTALLYVHVHVHLHAVHSECGDVLQITRPGEGTIKCTILLLLNHQVL